jgi:RNAse (barnase) inhibitor barstar
MEPMAKQLSDAQQSGVYRLVRPPEEVERAARDAGLAVFRIDIGHAHNKKTFLAKIADALQFPNWFGGNWDALNDLLTDMKWLTTNSGYVLIFEKGETNPLFEDANAVLQSAVEYWKAEGRPFWAFFEISASVHDLPLWPT